jgi:peptidoglycan/LPS O-acetylase OafA/YrhL
MKFQKHINGLRAIAVTAVLLYHFHIPGIDSGFVGVDVFLVISGYLMTYILMYGRESSPLQGLKEFYLDRVRRIVPALLIVTAMVVIVFGTFLLHSDFNKVVGNALASNLFVSNLIFKNQSGYFDIAAESNPLLHTWSLSVEWQFYLIYPFATLIFKRNESRRFFLVFVLSGILASFLFNIYATQIDAGQSYFSTVPRLWEFLTGALVAVLYAEDYLNSNRRIPTAILAVAIVGLTASVHFADKAQFPGWWALLPVISAATLVADGNSSFINRALSIRVVQFFGDISYSLYLWHWPILSYLTMTMVTDRPLSISIRIGGIVLSIVLAVFSHRWVEISFRDKSGYWTNLKILVMWAGTAAVLTLVAIFVGTRPEEYNYRLPAYLNGPDNALLDSNPRREECFQEAEGAQKFGYTPKFCSIGVPRNELQAIVWGASFADALQPAVDQALKAADLSGVVSAASGCPPIESVPYTDGAMRNIFKHCGLGLGRNTLSYIYHHKSLKLILMHANWSRYDAANFPSDMAKEICELKSNGKIVLLVGQVPQPPFDTPRYWAKMETSQRAFINELKFKEAPETNLIFNALTTATDSQCGGVQIVHPADVLCEAGYCSAVREGKAIYMDAAHLTKSGAMVLSKTILNSINQEISAN